MNPAEVTKALARKLKVVKTNSLGMVPMVGAISARMAKLVNACLMTAGSLPVCRFESGCAH